MQESGKGEGGVIGSGSGVNRVGDLASALRYQGARRFAVKRVACCVCGHTHQIWSACDVGHKLSPAVIQRPC